MVAALLIVGPALGGPEHELRRNVIAVIKSQIAAFHRDDGDMAFSYASPEVQSQFGTADSFLARFAATYKPVYRPKSVIFLNLAFSRGRLVQRVLLQGPDSIAVVALFPMMQMNGASTAAFWCQRPEKAFRRNPTFRCRPRPGRLKSPPLPINPIKFDVGCVSSPWLVPPGGQNIETMP